MRQHSAGAGHRSDIDGWDAGRYPEKAAKDFLKLPGECQEQRGRTGIRRRRDGHQTRRPHKVGERPGRNPRAAGATQWNTTLADVELIIEDPEADE